jgi:hypothetical protein
MRSAGGYKFVIMFAGVGDIGVFDRK